MSSSPALVAEHFVLRAICRLLPAVAGSATASGMTTRAITILSIADVSLQNTSPCHSAPAIPYSKPSTATKSPSLNRMHFLRGCQSFARIIQFMNFSARVANYMGFPLGSRLACLGYSDQSLDIYIYIVFDLVILLHPLTNMAPRIGMITRE